MKIGKGEHVFVAGRTGSGKTFLVKKYLQNVRGVYVLDLKKTLDWEGIADEDAHYLDTLKKVKASKRKKIIYQPRWEEMSQGYYNEFFEHIYKKGGCSVWIDETMGIGTSQKYPEYFKALLTRGRELGISVWSCTQRPAAIPIVAMSEATHLYVFDLNMRNDRKRIAEIAGQEKFLQMPGRFNFWYYNTASDVEAIKARFTMKGGE